MSRRRRMPPSPISYGRSLLQHPFPLKSSGLIAMGSSSLNTSSRTYPAYFGNYPIQQINQSRCWQPDILNSLFHHMLGYNVTVAFIIDVIRTILGIIGGLLNEWRITVTAIPPRA